MRLDWLEYFVFHEYSTTLLACDLRVRMLTAPMTVARTVVAAPKSLRTPAPGAGLWRVRAGGLRLQVACARAAWSVRMHGSGVWAHRAGAGLQRLVGANLSHGSGLWAHRVGAGGPT